MRPQFFPKRAPTRYEFVDHEQKGDIRKQIERFTLEHLDDRTGLHMLTLPGRGWISENRLSRRLGASATFVCFEHDWDTLWRSRHRLPGGPGRFVQLQLPGYGKLVRGYFTRRVVVLNTSAENLPAIMADAEPLRSPRYRDDWEVAQALSQMACTAVWLDFCNALEVQDLRGRSLLRRLPSCLDRVARTVPIAITAYNGRDKGLITGHRTPLLNRQDYIVQALRRDRDWACEDIKVAGYQGAGGPCSHMLLFTAVLRNRRYTKPIGKLRRRHEHIRGTVRTRHCLVDAAPRIGSHPCAVPGAVAGALAGRAAR